MGPMKIVVLDSTAIPGVKSGPGSAAYFSRYVIEHLLDLGHEIHVTNHLSPHAVDADVVWSEWCNELAFEAALSDVCKKLIIRVRGYDVWSPLDKMPWKNVHTLVYESKFLETLAREQFAVLPGYVRERTIPSGIDLDSIQYLRRNDDVRPTIALVARTTADKGYQLAFEYARQRPALRMHVTTALSESNPRLLRYLQHTKPHNVTIHGNVDTAVWLNQIMATHILSASIWETLGYTIAEGMAVGCRPLIHDGPGLATNWPVEHLWRSFDDLDRLVQQPVYSGVYRDYVEKHLSAKRGSEEFAKLVLE